MHATLILISITLRRTKSFCFGGGEATVPALPLNSEALYAASLIGQGMPALAPLHPASVLSKLPTEQNQVQRTCFSHNRQIKENI